MDANRLIELARDCGMFITTEMRWQIEQWERLAAAVTDEIATPAIAVEREACAKVCDERAWGIGGPAANCASDIRERSNGEVRGASRPAGEASSAEGATSTVVLEGKEET